jgi:hypothetical protein
MNQREATQWFLLSAAVALTSGAFITFTNGNFGAALIQSSSASVIYRFIDSDEDDEGEKSELIQTYKILAKDSPEALETWMDTLTDADVEYIYETAIKYD